MLQPILCARSYQQRVRSFFIVIKWFCWMKMTFSFFNVSEWNKIMLNLFFFFLAFFTITVSSMSMPSSLAFFRIPLRRTTSIQCKNADVFPEAFMVLFQYFQWFLHTRRTHFQFMSFEHICWVQLFLWRKRDTETQSSILIPEGWSISTTTLGRTTFTSTRKLSLPSFLFHQGSYICSFNVLNKKGTVVPLLSP